MRVNSVDAHGRKIHRQSDRGRSGVKRSASVRATFGVTDELGRHQLRLLRFSGRLGTAGDVTVVP